MKPLICFILLFFILLSTSIVQAQDETDIKNLIDANSGRIVQFPDGIYTIKNPFSVPSNTELRGSANTVFEFAPNCGIGKNIPMIQLDKVSNVKITNIKFRGNQETQTYALRIPNPGHLNAPSQGKAWGNQVNTFIYATYSDNITVTYCDFYDNLGDGLRTSYCNNIEFAYNTGSMGGHDILFCLRTSGVRAHHNNLKPLVNAAIRLLDVSHARIYNNVIEWVGPRDAGAAIQIQHDNGEMGDIEVCGNKILNSWGPAFWVVGKTGGNEELWIHDNLVSDAGLNHGIYWVGGVIASGYNNILLENNVFTGSYLGAVNFYAVSLSWATEATAIIRNNLIINSVPGKNNKAGGYGINNEIPKQDVYSTQNLFYSNAGGNYRGSVESTNDIIGNPATTQNPSNWVLINGEWIGPQVNPSTMGYIPTNDFSGLTPLTDEEIRKYEFNDIFDVTTLEFIDNALSLTQGNLIPVGAQWTEKKKAAAYIYLAGYEGQITINNHTFIPENPWECARVLTGTRNLASKPAGQTSELKLSEGLNNGLHAELKVKTIVTSLYNATFIYLI